MVGSKGGLEDGAGGVVGSKGGLEDGEGEWSAVRVERMERGSGGRGGLEDDHSPSPSSRSGVGPLPLERVPTTPSSGVD